MKIGRLASVFACILVFATCAAAQDLQRPSVPKLLPDKTLGMIRVGNLPETVKRFKAAAFGKMLNDPQLSGLTGHIYKRGEEEYRNRVEGEVNVPLEDLLKIPQGEIAVALVAGPDDRLNQLGFVVFLEVKDHIPQMKKLLERAERALNENGGSVSVEAEGDAELKIYTGGDGNSVMHFFRDGVMVVSNRRPHLQEVLARWRGEQRPSLADNANFNAVMSRCRPSVDQPVDVEVYLEPIPIVKTVARENPLAATFLASIPVLGIDGLQAAGATLTTGEGDFDSVIRAQVLMPTPRKGVLDLVAFKSDEAEPEPWAPDDLSSYMTVNWDIKKTYDAGAKVYNGLMGDGEFENEVRNRIDQLLGIDFATEFLPAVDGRLTLCSWIEPPARINSQSNLVGVKLSDPDAFKPVYEKIIAKYAERIEERKIAGTKVNVLRLPQGGPPIDENDPNPTIRRPEVCFCIWGDYVLMSDSTKFLEHCLKTGRDGTKTLAKDLEFKLIAGKIARQAGGTKPGLLSYSRPEEVMRNMYEMATSEANRQRVKEQATNNGFFRGIDDALTQHPLPPFSVFEKYLAPSGGLIILDESGLRYMTFSLKRE